MTYDEFKKAWGLSLRESGLPIMGVEPIEETVDLRTMDRTCESFVEPFGGQHAEPFHITAALKFRWDVLQTARTNTTEEDTLHELLGLDRTRSPRTELPWLRVDVTLRASIVHDQLAAMFKRLKAALNAWMEALDHLRRRTES